MRHVSERAVLSRAKTDALRRLARYVGVPGWRRCALRTLIERLARTLQ